MKANIQSVSKAEFTIPEGVTKMKFYHYVGGERVPYDALNRFFSFCETGETHLLKSLQQQEELKLIDENTE